MSHASSIIDKLNDINEKSFVQRHKGKLAAAAGTAAVLGGAHLKGKASAAGFTANHPGLGGATHKAADASPSWHSSMTGGHKASDATGLHKKAVAKGLKHAGGGVYTAGGGDTTKTATKKVASKAAKHLGGDSPVKSSGVTVKPGRPSPSPSSGPSTDKLQGSGKIQHAGKGAPHISRVRSDSDKAASWDKAHAAMKKKNIAKGLAHGSGVAGHSSPVHNTGASDVEKAANVKAHAQGVRKAGPSAAGRKLLNKSKSGISLIPKLVKP